MDRVAWWATVHGVAKSQDRIEVSYMHTHARRSHPELVSLIYLRHIAIAHLADYSTL